MPHVEREQRVRVPLRVDVPYAGSLVPDSEIAQRDRRELSIVQFECERARRRLLRRRRPDERELVALGSNHVDGVRVVHVSMGRPEVAATVEIGVPVGVDSVPVDVDGGDSLGEDRSAVPGFPALSRHPVRPAAMERAARNRRRGTGGGGA